MVSADPGKMPARAKKRTPGWPKKDERRRPGEGQPEKKRGRRGTVTMIRLGPKRCGRARNSRRTTEDRRRPEYEIHPSAHFAEDGFILGFSSSVETGRRI